MVDLTQTWKNVITVITIVGVLGWGNLLTSSAQSLTTDNQQQIQAILDQATRSNAIPGVQLLVFDSNTDQLVFDYQTGRFDPEEPIEIASATKWVTAAVFMALVTDDLLPLDATTGDYLGWEGSKAEITLSQLLSFTSGLNQQQFCLLRPGISLAECTDTVYEAEATAAPGTTFEYGGVHMTVAGRMAEVASGESWAALFEKYIREPLGLSDSANYWGLHFRKRPTDNPRLGGGLILTTYDYAKFLQMIDNYGRVNDRQLIRPDLIKYMEQSQFTPATVVKLSPAELLGYTFEYGLGNWVECLNPDCTDTINSSEGAFGYYPWIDRDAGYYALLAMKGEKQATKRSLEAVYQLRPYLESLVQDYAASQSRS